MSRETEGFGGAATGVLFVLFVAGLGFGGMAGSSLIGGPTGVLLGAGLALFLAGAVFWYIARAVNSTATPQGRVWHNHSAINGIPIQQFAALHPSLGVALIAGAIGRQTAGWFGCILFIGYVVAAVVLYRRFHARRFLALLADRRAYAVTHGLHYRDEDILVVHGRWDDLYPTAAALTPFGVLGGETDGLPYTIFDTMHLSEDGRTIGVKVPDQVRRTVWVVHLPAAYPRLRLTHETASRFMSAARRRESDEAVKLEVAAEAEDFRTAAVEAGVLPYSLQHELDDWWIEGRDLIMARAAASKDQPIPPAELISTVTALAGLGRLFTGPPLDRFGTAPTHDVPYAESSPRQP